MHSCKLLIKMLYHSLSPSGRIGRAGTPSRLFFESVSWSALEATQLERNHISATTKKQTSKTDLPGRRVPNWRSAHQVGQQNGLISRRKVSILALWFGAAVHLGSNLISWFTEHICSYDTWSYNTVTAIPLQKLLRRNGSLTTFQACSATRRHLVHTSIINTV